MSETAASTARILIEPSRALIDEKVSIRLAGFPEQELISVHARMEDDLGRTWSSEAAFLTDDLGNVDLTKQAPQSGTYQGLDPMGLVWSLALSANEKNLALFPKTGLTPTRISFRAKSQAGLEHVAELEQSHVAQGVTRKDVRDRGLRGTLFLPPGPGPHPAVIIIGGSGGGLQEGHAALCASRGIAALALAYFAFEDLPKFLIDIPMEYFEKAIDWMAEQPEVNEERLVLVGKSRGAELALQAGAMFSKVRGVIGYVPAHVIWSGIEEGTRGETFAWTFGGDGLTYVPTRMTPEQAAEIFGQERIPLTPMFLINLEDADAEAEAAIPVERINGPVLLISGKDDQMWPSSLMGERVIERLLEHNHPYSFEHFAYEDAGHMILVPYLQTTRNYSQHPVTGQVYAFGGTPEGYAAANRDSWAQVLAFMQDAFE